jgi:hypothetical protein
MHEMEEPSVRLAEVKGIGVPKMEQRVPGLVVCRVLPCLLGSI